MALDTTELLARATRRVGELRSLEEEAFTLRSRIEKNEMLLEATRHGYRLEVSGSNEKEREARLRQALSEDRQYVSLHETALDLRAELGALQISITYEERMHKLELATIRGGRND